MEPHFIAFENMFIIKFDSKNYVKQCNKCRNCYLWPKRNIQVKNVEIYDYIPNSWIICVYLLLEQEKKLSNKAYHLYICWKTLKKKNSLSQCDTWRDMVKLKLFQHRKCYKNSIAYLS